ncbi:MAG: hypothetical protein R3C97_06135 [Geminicoccaceae bacterium]
MSATTAPTPFTPRAVLELALCMADGGTAQEALEVSGIDPVLAERMLDNWAFILLLKILPMLIGHRRKSGNRPRTEKERSRIEKAAAPVLRLFGEEQGEGTFSITRHLRAIRRQQAHARAAAEAEAEAQNEVEADVRDAADRWTHSQAQAQAEARDQSGTQAADHPQSLVQAPDLSLFRARSKTRPQARPAILGLSSRIRMNDPAKRFKMAAKGKNVEITLFSPRGAGSGRLSLIHSVPRGALFWSFEKSPSASGLNCVRIVHI